MYVMNLSHIILFIMKRYFLYWNRKINHGIFDKLWIKFSRFPKNISLSLSLLCPSNCIYCAERGLGIKPKLMPFELVQKILHEAKEIDFKGRFSLSENGEALVNPNFKKIVEEIRKLFPENEIVLYTNMVLMDENMCEFLLQQNLNYLHFNFDGLNEKNYEYIKQNGSYNKVKQNILNFIKLRNELNSHCSIGIGIVGAKRFSEDIEAKSRVFEDDEKKIIEFFKPLLRLNDDICPNQITLEKYQYYLNRRKKEPCDLFERILKEIFIAPNGQVYICCADFGVTSKLGNVNQAEIKEIWSSEIRKNILINLFESKNNKSFEICQTCLPNYYSINRDLYYRVRKQVRMAFSEKQVEIINGKLIINNGE